MIGHSADGLDSQEVMTSPITVTRSWKFDKHRFLYGCAAVVKVIPPTTQLCNSSASMECNGSASGTELCCAINQDVKLYSTNAR